MIFASHLAKFIFENIRLILIPWVGINLAALIIYFMDKRKAERADWRISEAMLLWIGLAAPFGAFAGTRLFRHKTRKLRFRLLLPLFLIAHLALWVGLSYLYFS